MIKMTQLFRFPTKQDALDFYTNTYKDLLASFDGLERFEAGEVQGLPMGSLQPQLIVDLYFEDAHAMDAAFATEHGKRISRELTNIGGRNIDIFESSVIE